MSKGGNHTRFCDHARRRLNRSPYELQRRNSPNVNDKRRKNDACCLCFMTALNGEKKLLGVVVVAKKYCMRNRKRLSIFTQRDKIMCYYYYPYSKVIPIDSKFIISNDNLWYIFYKLVFIKSWSCTFIYSTRDHSCGPSPPGTSCKKIRMYELEINIKVIFGMHPSHKYLAILLKTLQWTENNFGHLCH